MEFQTIIGLEVHAQVRTNSKMFSPCTAVSADAAPNTAVDPVSLGLPGTLPTVNRAAVEKTIMTGLALNCEIPRFSRFDRKNYMYPDLMKGYQISQYDLPLCRHGHLDVEIDGETRRIGITRVHLEEDTARLIHRSDSSHEYSLVDVNRAGIPLMEIVSEPDIRSPEEARAYLLAMRQILRYIGASSGNMEEGAFRVDANISQRTTDGSIVGAKVEVKNMNSFRSVERALHYEVERQRAAIQAGDEIVQETRGWVEDAGITVSQRTKEFAEDYRYFPEPDLPPLEIDHAWVAAIKANMAELPATRRDRFVEQYQLSRDDATVLTDDILVADYFERLVEAAGGRARDAANWITGELFALARNAGGFDKIEVPVDHVAELILMVNASEINLRTAKEVLGKSVAQGASPRAIVEREGLSQVSDSDVIRNVARQVIAENEAAVADYRSGKKAAIGFLIGQAMRQLRGAGNPNVVRKELIRILDQD